LTIYIEYNAASIMQNDV